MNILAKLIEQNKNRPKDTAVKYFKKGQLYSLNWSQVYDRINQIHSALINLGIEKGDHICIYSNTSKEWGFLDLAIQACHAVTVPIYHSAHPDEVKEILEDSKPKHIFIENEALYKTYKKTNYQIDGQVVSINDFSTNDESLLFLKNIIDCQSSEISLEEASGKIVSSDLATIIYTSGTSGLPKGVCLTHTQIQSAVSEVFPLLGITNLDCTLTFLPFSHVLGRIELWGHYFCGYTIGYAESIEKIKRNLPKISPTVIVGVPRIFEKIYFGIKAQIEISKLKQNIFNKALNIGMKNTKLRQQKKSPSLFQAIGSQLAYQMVFANIHKKMGGNLRFAVSGGAPLDPEIADFFAACGLPILEGYGLTETTGPIFVNTLFQNQNGTVGQAIGDVKVKLNEDGEILVKSNKVMTQYHQKDNETQSVFDEDGFFRTGDIGEINSQGFLKITDRKKDLIKTAGGKFVAPQKLQKLFSTDALIGHIHIHGDKKKYIVALLTLEKDRLMQLKDQFELSSNDFSQLSQSDTIQKIVRQSVAEVNSGLASYETIKRFKVLDHEFTIEDGHLTPSLKMKRKKIDEIYKTEINDLYV